MSDWERKRAARCEDLKDNSTLVNAVEEIVERLGYECVHVSIKTDSGRPRLQVLIDSLGGINVDDCETVSKALNRMLDSKDFHGLENQYYLEVSSPGLERPLFTPAHYERFQGREVRIQLAKPLEGRKTLTGKILAVQGQDQDHEQEQNVRITVYLESEEREMTVSFGDIKNGKLVFRAFEPKEPVKSKRTKQTRGLQD